MKTPIHLKSTAVGLISDDDNNNKTNNFLYYFTSCMHPCTLVHVHSHSSSAKTRKPTTRPPLKLDSPPSLVSPFPTPATTKGDPDFSLFPFQPPSPPQTPLQSYFSFFLRPISVARPASSAAAKSTSSTDPDHSVPWGTCLSDSPPDASPTVWKCPYLDDASGLCVLLLPTPGLLP